MSDTSKAADVAKKVTDYVAKSNHANVEAAHSVHEAEQAAQQATNRARDLGNSINETVRETAKDADQGREVLMMGVRTAAGVGSRVADVNYGRGQQLMSSAAQAIDVYRDASERSAERVQALFSSVTAMGRGLQTMQHAWLEMLGHSMDTATHKPQDLLRCKNMVELAEVQRDLYVGAVNHAVESTTRLLELAGATARDAARPLQSQRH